MRGVRFSFLPGGFLTRHYLLYVFDFIRSLCLITRLCLHANAYGTNNGHTGKATKASIHRNVVFVISLRGFYPFGVLQIMYVWWHVDPMFTV